MTHAPTHPVNVAIDTHGNLQVSIDQNVSDAHAEIQDRLDANGFWDALEMIFEPHATNGSYEAFDAANANPYVGISSAICVAESIDTDEEGKRTISGDFWFYDDLMKCPIDELLEKGQVVFTKKR